MARFLKPTFVGAVTIAALAGTAPPSVAATGVSDTATPNYRTDAAANGSNKFECSNGVWCTFTINTKTTNYPCTAEVIVLASGQPTLLYPNTFCQVSISGTFEAVPGSQQDPCALYAFQSLQVNFTSGAHVLFNGGFQASGLFKPTAFNADRTRITQAQITVKGADTLDANPAGTGSIKGATFTVRLPGSGIYRSMCNPYTASNPGYVAAVPSDGTVVIAP